MADVIARRVEEALICLQLGITSLPFYTHFQLWMQLRSCGALQQVLA